MADYKVTDNELTSIANAIRAKGGTSAQLEFPEEFVSAIEDISSSSGTVETASIFKWQYSSATTCWGVMKKLTGDVIGQNGDNANVSIALVGELMTATFHGGSQAVEVVANTAIKLKAYTTGRTLGPATMTEYTMAANAQQNFTTDILYGGLYLEASPT